MLESTITPLNQTPMTVKVNGKPVTREVSPVTTSLVESEVITQPVNVKCCSLLALGTWLGFTLMGQSSLPTSREYYSVPIIDADAAYNEMTNLINHLHHLAQTLETLSWALFSLAIAVGAVIFVWKIVNMVRRYF